MVLGLFRKTGASREDAEKRRHIAAVLDCAMAQRSKIHLQFDEKATSLTGLTAIVVQLAASDLVLELGGVSNLQQRFVGQPVTCFFKIVEREHRQRETFYSFDTTILTVRPQTGAPPRLALALPERLRVAQRRKSLRLRPDLERFSHLALWKHGAGDCFDPAQPTVGREQFEAREAVLENFSAGGLRLGLGKALLRARNLDPQKGDRFILFFTFAEDLPRLRREYWLVGRINNIRPDPVSGDVAFGLEFIANGVRQEESCKVVWQRIDDNVVDDLAQRLYQWHLELYRDKGLAG